MWPKLDVAEVTDEWPDKKEQMALRNFWSKYIRKAGAAKHACGVKWLFMFLSGCYSGSALLYLCLSCRGLYRKVRSYLYIFLSIYMIVYLPVYS